MEFLSDSLMFKKGTDLWKQWQFGYLRLSFYFCAIITIVMPNIPDDFVNKFYLEPNMSFSIALTINPGIPGEQYIRVIGQGRELFINNGGGPRTLNSNSDINNTTEYQEWTFQSGNKDAVHGGKFNENYHQYMLGANGFFVTLFNSWGGYVNPVGLIEITGNRH